MAILKFNQEDNGDRTRFFGIPLTAAINVHGAFPKSDRFVAGLALANAPYQSGNHTIPKLELYLLGYILFE